MANKTYDTLGLIVASEVVGATATCTGANIVGLNVGSKSYVAVINTSVTTGTVDGSNYYTVQLVAGATLGGTYYPVGNAIVLPATAGQYQIGFTSEQLEQIVTGGEFFAVTVTKTGTTATAVTYTAFISEI